MFGKIVLSVLCLKKKKNSTFSIMFEKVELKWLKKIFFSIFRNFPHVDPKIHGIN